MDGARLTLDYPVDLEVFKAIIETLSQTGGIFNLEQVVAFLMKHPEIIKINADLDEEYWQRTKDKAQLMYTDGSGNPAKIEV